jgi:hypothetical protein
MPGSRSRRRVRLSSGLGALGSKTGAGDECGEGTGQGGGRVSSPRRRDTERAAIRSSVTTFGCDEGAPMEGGGLWWFVQHKSDEGVRDKFTRWEKAQRNGSLKWGGDGSGGSKFGDSGGGS